MSAMSKSSAMLVGEYWLYVITDDTSTEPLPATGESVGADFGMEGRFLDTEHR